MKFLNLFKEQKNKTAHGWRNLDALPGRVITKAELDGLQKEVVDEIDRVLEEAVAKAGVAQDAKPQTLFYCHKYIDSKFNKSDFDIDSYYIEKQNLIDAMYSEGLGELESEYTGYASLLAKIREVEQRLNRKTNVLDPESELDEQNDTAYDDSESLRLAIAELPRELNWQEEKEI